MKHTDEETLLLYHYGDSDDAAGVVAHLRDCAPCRAELDAIRQDLREFDAIPVPERGDDYGSEVWRAIEPKLERRGAQTRSRNVWLLAAAALVLASTFLAGRLSTRFDVETPGGDVRERILLVALDEHLDRSQVLLLELVNASDEETGRQAARELVHESRLYRQAAYRSGDVATSDVLDELERVLLDVAHGTSSGDLLKLRIEEQDVLFKIRALQTSVRAELTPQKF